MSRGDHEVPWSRLTLVSGPGRSGTTWLGDLLAGHPRLEYLFEPYSHRYHPELPTSETAFRLMGSHYDPRRSPVPFWYYHGAALDALEQHGHVLREHLAALVRHSFPGRRPDHLVIKQPAAEKLRWMVGVLQPDDVILMRRHPGGVLNSYLSWGMLSTWSDPEFELARRTAHATVPELEDAFGQAATDIERFMVLFILKERLLAADDLGCPVHRVQYEELCQDPAGVLRQTCAFLGVEDDDEVLTRCLLSIRGARPRAAHLDLNVDSRRRADDWQRRLSPRTLRTMHEVAGRLGYSCSLPGFGLPRQSRWIRFSCGVRDATRAVRQTYRSLRAKIPVRRIVARLVPGLGRAG